MSAFALKRKSQTQSASGFFNFNRRELGRQLKDQPASPKCHAVNANRTFRACAARGSGAIQTPFGKEQGVERRTAYAIDSVKVVKHAFLAARAVFVDRSQRYAAAASEESRPVKISRGIHGHRSPRTASVIRRSWKVVQDGKTLAGRGDLEQRAAWRPIAATDGCSAGNGGAVERRCFGVDGETAHRTFSVRAIRGGTKVVKD